MNSNTRYDQVVRGRVPPYWEEPWLGPQVDRNFVASRGGARFANREIPAARRIYSSDKPCQPAPQTTCALNLKDNSIYSNSPHWGTQWWGKITNPLPPPLYLRSPGAYY
jgi:hypothetical protein